MNKPFNLNIYSLSLSILALLALALAILILPVKKRNGKIMIFMKMLSLYIIFFSYKVIFLNSKVFKVKESITNEL